MHVTTYSSHIYSSSRLRSGCQSQQPLRLALSFSSHVEDANDLCVRLKASGGNHLLPYVAHDTVV